MQHVKDIQYNGHELSIGVDKLTQQYWVDIRSDEYDGAYIAGYGEFATLEDAYRAGKIYINGYIDGKRNFKGE